MSGQWVNLEDLPEATAGAKEISSPDATTKLWKLGEGRWIMMRSGDEHAWSWSEDEVEISDDGDERPIEEVLDELGV